MLNALYKTTKAKMFLFFGIMQHLYFKEPEEKETEQPQRPDFEASVLHTTKIKVKETGVVEKGTSRLAQLQWAHEKWWSIFPVHYDWTLLFKCHIFNSFYGWIDYCIDVRLEKHHLVSCICHKPIRFNHESLTILVGLVTFPFWKTAPVLYQ